MALSDEATAQILLQLCQQNVDRANHHQEQRAAVANLLLILAGGLIALAALDQKITRLDLFPASFMVSLGVVGAVWSAKQHERYAFYDARAQFYKVSLNALLVPDLRRIERLGAAAASYRHPLLHRLTVWRLWVGLYVFVAILGLGLAITSLVAPDAGNADAGPANPSAGPAAVRPS